MQKLWGFLGRAVYFVTQTGIRIVVGGSHRTRVLIICDDQCLVLKHWLGDGSWTLPGGGLHKNEDALAGAQREVLEEIGLTIKPSSFIHKGTFEVNDDGFKFSYDLFIVRLNSMPELRLQTIEILQAKWLKISDLSILKLTPEIRQAVTIWQE